MPNDYEVYHSIVNKGQPITIDWTKANSQYRVQAKQKIPAIVYYTDGSFKLGHIVTRDLGEWVRETPNVFRVEVQMGTREALRHETTDLF